MPTVLQHGPYRFFFYSNEWGEPPHIHVVRDNCAAKFWLSDCSLASSTGFKGRELREIAWIVRTHRDDFLQRWHDFFVANS
jgi:uncharacterized protein DUF4160